MLGRQHLMLTLATTAVLLTPLLEEYPGFVAVMFFGAGVGSLIPDVDAEDAAVFHSDIKGLNGELGKAVNSSIGPFLPYFGYSTKYLIFKPAVKVFDLVTPSRYRFQEKHRTFTHSIIGVLTMTALTGLYLSPVLIVLKIFNPFYLAAFLAAYMFGAFLHMVQDSCTKTGIKWNSPFSDWKLYGDLSTGKDIRKPRFFLTWLIFASPVSIYIVHVNDFGVLNSVLLAVSFVCLSWLAFMKFVSGVEFVDSS